MMKFPGWQEIACPFTGRLGMFTATQAPAGMGGGQVVQLMAVVQQLAPVPQAVLVLQCR